MTGKPDPVIGFALGVTEINRKILNEDWRKLAQTLTLPAPEKVRLHPGVDLFSRHTVAQHPWLQKTKDRGQVRGPVLKRRARQRPGALPAHQPARKTDVR